MSHATRFVFDPPAFVLIGIVDDRSISELRNRMFERSSQISGRQIVDCSRTTEFTGMALVLLSALINEIRDKGGDLLLLHLPEKIQLSMSDKLIDELIPPFLIEMVRKLVRDSRKIAPAVQGTHSTRISPN